MHVAQELELQAAVLELIERRREETRDEGLGSGIERYIIERQLRAVDEQITEDPGALAGMLVPLRRGRT